MFIGLNIMRPNCYVSLHCYNFLEFFIPKYPSPNCYVFPNCYDFSSGDPQGSWISGLGCATDKRFSSDGLCDKNVTKL